MWFENYIDYAKLYNEEICLQSSLELMEMDMNENSCKSYRESYENLKRLIACLPDLELLTDECYVEEHFDGFRIVIAFGCKFGQNESDNQGSFYGYDITVNEDFNVIGCVYDQG